MKKFIEKFKERYVRKSGKITDILPIAVVESILIVLFGSIFTMPFWLLLGLPLAADPEQLAALLPPAVYTATTYFEFIGIWILVALVIFIPPANRRMIKDILPNKRGNTIVGIALGILLGFGCNAICILFSMFLGDIAISFREINVLNLLMIYGAVLIQSGAEEIVDRLFLYEKLRRRYKSPWVAIITNAVVFTLLHLTNPGVTPLACAQIFVIGVLFSLFVFYFDSLWVAIFFHTTWNFTQNIVFGCPNSGIVSSYSIFGLDAASDGLFFDARFGVEGAIGAVLILVALTVGVYLFARRHELKEQDLWADLNAVPAVDDAAALNEAAVLDAAMAEGVPVENNVPTSGVTNGPKHFR